MPINPSDKPPIHSMNFKDLLFSGKRVMDELRNREFSGVSEKSNPQAQAEYERKLKEKRTYIESGGALRRDEIDISAALKYQYENESRLKIAQQKAALTRYKKQIESSDISQQEKEDKIYEMEKQTEESIGQISQQKIANLAASSIYGVDIDKKSLRKFSFKGEVGKAVSSFAGTYKQVVDKDIESELERTRGSLQEEMAGGRQLRKKDFGHYMQRAIESQESKQGTTFEKSRSEIISGAILSLEKVASSTKGVSDQFKVLDKELGTGKKDIKDYSDNLNKFGSGLSSMHNVAASTLRAGTIVEGVIGSLKSGNIIGATSGVLSAGSTAAQAGRGLFSAGTAMAGAIGLGGAATTAMGVGALLGGTALIASVVPTIVGLTLASVAYKDADKYYKELGDYQKGIYGAKALSGGGLPSRADYNTYIKYGMQAGMTVPEYTQTALLLGSTGLMSKEEQKRSFTRNNGTGVSDIAEISRTAMYLNRPVQELTSQIGSYLKSTSGSTPGQMMNMMQSLAGSGKMRGTMFTGELQGSMAGLSEVLMQSFGGAIKSVSSASISKILSPLMQAGITPSGAAGLVQSVTSATTNAFFNPQSRLFLQYMGMSEETMLKGYRNKKGANGKYVINKDGEYEKISAYDDFMENLGLTEEGMRAAGTHKKGEKGKRSAGLQKLLDASPLAEGQADIGSRVAAALKSTMPTMGVDQINKIVLLAEQQDRLANNTASLSDYIKKLSDVAKQNAEAENKRLKQLRETKGLESFNQKILEIKTSVAGFLEGMNFGKDAAIRLNAIKIEVMHLLGNFGREGVSFLDVIKDNLKGINDDISKQEKPDFKSMFGSLMKGVGSAAAEAIALALGDKKIIDAAANGFVALIVSIKDRMFTDAGKVASQDEMIEMKKAASGKYGLEIGRARAASEAGQRLINAARSENRFLGDLETNKGFFEQYRPSTFLANVERTQRADVASALMASMKEAGIMDNNGGISEENNVNLHGPALSLFIEKLKLITKSFSKGVLEDVKGGSVGEDPVKADKALKEGAKVFRTGSPYDAEVKGKKADNASTNFSQTVALNVNINGSNKFKIVKESAGSSILSSADQHTNRRMDLTV
jgi:hypothetical protein